MNGGEALVAAAGAGPPLLAYGANAAPERLAGKLGPGRAAALAGRLRGFAVVHSAHVSPYGAVPATLVPDPEGVADVHVLLLDGWAGIGSLDLTEPNYDRVLLEGLDLEAEHVGAVPAAYAYLSKWGPLEVAGAVVPLGSRSQADLLRLVGR